MQKVKSFLENLKYKSAEDQHSFAIFMAFILTLLVSFFILFSWYLEFYDLPIENTLLTRLVSFFE